ncbi:nucleolar GTP-binding protein 2 [Nannizzia gypsea CBS 118893]|uniref:Nucleolar GTP-binding protein 2 n=1 Tax=Arthroderma gypseum (strain ATCC MYA-4604 / CBS 118893) TaxID=535722 RepID=E4UTK0_ARTGP|nr:nucleolar GTP-binding protein 2 [Nannizzia gypsea CBS 118893]EFR00709.1 nucleolar GTP-binding protein 2 [Nannizzia gypsea CBS 118893]
MVLAKSKNSVGLGNSLMNDRFGKGKRSDRKKVSHNAAAIQRKGTDGETYITNPTEEASWVKMRSITEQAALDEFLSTAELAGTDFTAEKMNNVKIIHQDQKNPYLLSAADERNAIRKHQKNRARLTVPRRPKWNERTTRNELDVMERESFLDWRRGLAELREVQDILMTPFERNLQVWRQLWRVLERSDLCTNCGREEPASISIRGFGKICQRSEPCEEKFAREAWADYFEEHNISYKFFSAALAKEMNEANEQEDESDEDEGDVEAALVEKARNARIHNSEEAEEAGEEEEEEDDDDDEDEDDDDGGLPLPEGPESERTEIITVDELEALFMSAAPPRDPSDEKSKDVTTIGLVGYPNVGKSSTINALLGSKKVSVSATPGKTKHFQTLYLTPKIVLCDCPGLVFPNFATTKAELVVNGVLPIDQLREYTGPAGLVAQRIPHDFLEAVYGMKIPIRSIEEGGTGVPTASEILRAYARARGFATTGLGQPDESRAARYVLKDYVNGKLLFCHPPPKDPPFTDPKERADYELEFNEGLYDMAHLPARRKEALLKEHAAATRGDQVDGIDDDIDLDSVMTPSHTSGNSSIPVQSARSKKLDKGFFGPGGAGSAGHLKMPFSYKYSEVGKQKEITGRKQRTLIALEKNIDVSEVRGPGKKHFKANKKVKTKKKGNSFLAEEE